ncbi:MAG: SRPBCC family protein [Nitrospiraceae bacterium]|nr:MAG: SRPBCC family protein [Nitrospiraceae bacterium]
MEISHSIVIHADMDTVWNIFTDLTCWKKWSTVLRESSSDEDRLSEGKRFRFCLRPFAFPVHVEPRVEEVIPGKRIAWSATRYGIHARHEFVFERDNGAVLLTSREIFNARGIRRLLVRVPRRKLHRLSVMMLRELKEASEQAVKS